jgi:hypothetical protein
MPMPELFHTSSVASAMSMLKVSVWLGAHVEASNNAASAAGPARFVSFPTYVSCIVSWKRKKSRYC